MQAGHASVLSPPDAGEGAVQVSFKEDFGSYTSRARKERETGAEHRKHDAVEQWRYSAVAETDDVAWTEYKSSEETLIESLNTGREDSP